MTQSSDLLRGELERLFELDDMMSLTSQLLGIDPAEIGGSAGKGAFARALVARCQHENALEALAEAILLTPKGQSAREGVTKILAGTEGEFTAGQTVGDFRIVKKLGQGGLGVVYAAERTVDGAIERAALKVIRSGFARDRASVQRFLTVNRALSTVAAPGLVRVLGVGELADGRPWVATELLDGQSLGARIARLGPMHVNEAKALFRDVLEGLTRLHQRGIVHGHIKAENVFVVRGRKDAAAADAKDLTAVLVDGGSDRLLARLYSNGAGVVPVFGTAKSLDPVVVRGGAPTPESDLYAVAVTLYEVLAGRPPFVGESAMDVVAHQLVSDAEVPSTHAPKGWVSAALDQLLLKALSKDPSERYQSAGEMLRALDEVGLRKSASNAPRAALDEKAFDQAAKAFLAQPTNDAAADKVEEIAAPAFAWDRVLKLFGDAAANAEDEDGKKALLLRIARIHHLEREDLAAASDAYNAVLGLDSGDRTAKLALLDILRAGDDPEALVEALLENVEEESDLHVRGELLGEIARTYESKLENVDGALVAWITALGDAPGNAQYVHEIERLATTPEQWQDVVTSLTESATEAGTTPRAAEIYVILGRWYGGQLQHPDYARNCLAQAISIDPTNDAAFDALVSVYRKAQSWRELVGLLEQRAQKAQSASRARDFRAQSAEIMLQQFNDGTGAEPVLRGIVADDPAHPLATDLLEQIFTRGQRWQDLGKLLTARANNESRDAKAQTLVRVGELNEDQLDQLDAAAKSYEAALAADPQNAEALKGLDRVYARQGKYPELLQILERELAASPTPRQRIAVLERIGSLQEEEFVDRDKALSAFEQITAIEPGHDGANTALARLYRHQQKFDKLAETLDRHARATENEARKTDLLLKAAQVFAVEVGSPGKALALCERILAVSPSNTEALELMARLQTSSGDKSAAINVMDKLAESEANPTKKAEQWLRAGRLFEEKGDRDGAAERYKKALDADANFKEASTALRRVYSDSGDARGAAELLAREIDTTKGESAKAKLHAELGQLYLTRLTDVVRAKVSFETALSLDPTCSPAQAGLGNVAFEAGDFTAAAHHLEPLLARVSSLPKDEARNICVRCGDAFRALSNYDKAQRAYLNARAIAPDDREVLERVADVTFEAGEADEALELYRDLHAKFADKVTPAEKGQILLRLGEITRRAGHAAEAIPHLTEAQKLLPSDVAVVDALANAYGDQGQWAQAAKILEGALAKATTETARFDLLVRLGDLAGSKLNDRPLAIRSYESALGIKGDARNVLTKLMGIYSEAKAWPQLVEVILRIADLVNDPAQTAKYYRTVGSIYLGELKKPDQAAQYYAQALEQDPSSEDTFAALVNCLEQNKDFTAVANAYRDQLVRVGKTAPGDKRAALHTGLGRVYARHLSDVPAAIEAFEKAFSLDPTNVSLLEELVAVYDRDIARFGDKARVLHDALIQRNPGRVQSYDALYRIHRHQGNFDGAWCVAQTLRRLGQADDEQKEFFKSRRVKSTLATEARIDAQTWRELVNHPEQDPLLTAIFTTITPVVLNQTAQPLSAYRVSAAEKIDAENDDRTPVVRALKFAAWVANLPLPEVYTLPQDPGGLSFMFTAPPAIGLGTGAFATLPAHVVGFVGARHLSFLASGHYVRHLVPNGTGLKAWLLGAIRVAQPGFQVPADLEQQVAHCHGALMQGLAPQLREVLHKLVAGLLSSSPSLDLKRWLAAVDKTADRLGFIVANDLEHSVAVIAASPEDSSLVARDERIHELEAYCASTAYQRLREKLGVTLKA